LGYERQAGSHNGRLNRPTPMTAAPSNPAYGALTTEGNSTNIAWHHTSVDRAAWAQQRSHRSAILWFTGLSGAGKSTLANAVNAALFAQGLACYVLDGDNIRHGLCKDLGFSDADREENIRRIGEVAKLFVDAGVVALTAFVSPFKADRDKVRALVPTGDFIEIHCAADLGVCEQRDTKGLYAKARAGEIKEFTGISSPYEAPEHPELRVDTGSQSLEQGVAQVLAYLQTAGIIPQAAG
jgi:adenylylsulfate kinase